MPTTPATPHDAGPPPQRAAEPVTPFHAPGELPQAGERALDLAAAWQRGREAAAEDGLTPCLTDEGHAWSCRLRLGDGGPAPGGEGRGKGARDAARVGALYEALEHHRSHAAHIDPRDTVARPAHALAAGPLAAEPGVALLAEGPDAPVPCRPHTALSPSAAPSAAAGAAAGDPGTGRGPGDRLDVPVYLTCPTYLSSAQGAALRRRLGDTLDYSSAARYSHNSGTAIGASRAEALVHGLAESVERDALSQLLAATFLDAAPPPLRRVDPGTVPPALGALLAVAARALDRPVHLLEMTTDLGVPAYCAYAAPEGEAAVQGYGASLSAAYAAYRALSELLQLATVQRLVPAAPPDLRALRRYPRLLAAGRADFGPHLADARPVPFTPTSAPATPGGHARALVAALAARGYPPYARTLHTASNGVCTVSTFVPGLERFFHVTYGQPIVPGPRARRARRTARR